jgi:hypothetical protein
LTRFVEDVLWEQILSWVSASTGSVDSRQAVSMSPIAGKSLGLGTYWLVSGFFSWIIVLWILALLMTSDLLGVLRQAPARNIFWAYTFGVLWGLGGLTFGLTRRYLCMSLGMAVALGYTAAFGTLMPPIFSR